MIGLFVYFLKSLILLLNFLYYKNCFIYYRKKPFKFKKLKKKYCGLYGNKIVLSIFF